MKTLTAFLYITIFATCLQAAKVEAIKVHSDAMGKDIDAIAVIPDKAGADNRCPVVYILHGYSGGAKSWIQMKPELAEFADRDHTIYICPGVGNSWYWDSPVKASSRYETFMTKELIAYVDGKYPTKADRKARAITGLSMGGHGAMFLSMRHLDIYGAAGSMSGGLDVRPFHNNWEVRSLLGELADNRLVWDDYMAINQIERINNGDLALIIDCGYADFFFEVNNDFHAKLLKHGIMHDYYVRAGGHTGDYWKNAIEYQLLFFKNYFGKK